MTSHWDRIVLGIHTPMLTNCCYCFSCKLMMCSHLLLTTPFAFCFCAHQIVRVWLVIVLRPRPPPCSPHSLTPSYPVHPLAPPTPSLPHTLSTPLFPSLPHYPLVPLTPSLPSLPHSLIPCPPPCFPRAMRVPSCMQRGARLGSSLKNTC